MTIERDKKGKFSKGKSANPAGRPAGSTSAATIRKAIEKESGDIIGAVIASAKNGDMTAARILIDRICPALKAKDLPVALSGLDGSMTEQGQKIIEGMGKGVLTPVETASMLSALANLAKITEIDDLTKRIEELENNLNG